jgi:hypothetical protein
MSLVLFPDPRRWKDLPADGSYRFAGCSMDPRLCEAPLYHRPDLEPSSYNLILGRFCDPLTSRSCDLAGMEIFGNFLVALDSYSEYQIPLSERLISLEIAARASQTRQQASRSPEAD